MAWQSNIHAQTPKRDPSEALRQLLNLPAPRPTDPEQYPAPEYPITFFDPNNPPPDDAPVGDLLTYWSRFAYRNGVGPSDTVRQRLFEFCLDNPALFTNFIYLVPQTKVAATKIKEVYDKAELTAIQREQIKKWLLFNSDFFLDELLAQVKNVKEDEKNGTVENVDALNSLVKVKWEAGEPLLRDLIDSAQPRLAALANTLFYQHAIDEKDSAAEEKYRKILKTIASNRDLPSQARDLAIGKLTSTEWDGRDEWYLALFQDETLTPASDGEKNFWPLTALCVSNPDKWIPVMARMVESKDLRIRSAAANCLINVNVRPARKDALMPLLPWLSNPKWVGDKLERGRLQLIGSMEDVDMPESVPGLLWVVENDDGEAGYNRSSAAQSLVRYKDPRAAPALKRALANEKQDIHRGHIIAALIASQGLTDTEQLEALEAYATQLTSDEGRADVERHRNADDEQLPMPVIIGKYLGHLVEVPESLVQAVLTRAETLKSDNPPLATVLIQVAHRWQGRQIDLDMITRIANGSADATTINVALKRRATLRQNLTPQLQSLASVSGMAPGIGAVLLENPSLAHDVLTSKDQLAQIALLACSRRTNTRLPVDLVGPFLRSKNELLALAAERYLLLEDSKQAQELLWQHHPNKAFITGWGENAENVYENFKQAPKAEEKFRAELLKEDGPIEIIALIGTGSEIYDRVLRIFSGKAVYTHYEDPARYREREVSKAELASFKQFLTTRNYADLGPQFDPCYHSCTTEQFLTMTSEKGRRVYSQQDWATWSDLRGNLDRLGEGATLHYNLEKEIKGLEVLLADKSLPVRDVWRQGDETRVLIQSELTEEEIAKQGEDADEDDSEAALIDRWRRQVASHNAPFSWRVYSNNKAGALTSQPDIYSTIDLNKFPPDDENNSILDDDDEQVQRLTDNAIIIARTYDGLWKQLAGTKPVKVSDGEFYYSQPIATADGKWVVVSKEDVSLSKPTYIVRFNVRTGREFRVNLEPADEFTPIAFVVTQNKVLLRRAKNQHVPAKQGIGPDRPEHHLLDPATGDTRLVTGEFTPLYQKGKRFLQPTDQPNEFWAAIPDENKKQTQVGRYNVKDFTFRSLLTVPQISFTSLSMWVDERQKKLYVVYEGQLLRLPLP
ncbi:MAG TPA: HEAT repeat domain-containing protein [Pyrinomonadaceae bacterium]|nr:HEAT repeat domain-containing protein [Pyrinomonadaceae bacterium]